MHGARKIYKKKSLGVAKIYWDFRQVLAGIITIWNSFFCGLLPCQYMHGFIFPLDATKHLRFYIPTYNISVIAILFV